MGLPLTSVGPADEGTGSHAGGEPRAFRREEVQHCIRHCAGFLRRQRYFLVSAAGAIVVLATGLSYVIDPFYTAKASFVLERSRNPSLRNETERPITSIEASNDLRDMLQSRPVIEAVVDDLRPYDAPRNNSSLRAFIEKSFDTLGIMNAMSPRERFIRRWGRSLLVDAEGDYVTVSLSNEDPVVAAAVVNKVMEAYQQKYVEMLRASQGSKLRQDLFDRAQSELSSLQDTLMRSDQPVSANPRGYASVLWQLHLVRQWIATIDQQILSLRSQLGPDHADTRAAERMSRSLQLKLADMEAEIRALDRSASRSEEVQIMIRASTEAVEAARKRLERSKLLEQSDTRTVSLRLAEYAVPPSLPDTSRLFQVFAGLAGGIVFALCAAIIRDRLKTRPDSIDSIEAILRSPVRGSLGDSRKMARALRLN